MDTSYLECSEPVRIIFFLPHAFLSEKKGASGNESETSELSAHLTYRSKTRKILEYRKLSTSTNEYSVLDAQVEYVHKHQPVDPNELINDNL